MRVTEVSPKGAPVRRNNAERRRSWTRWILGLACVVLAVAIITSATRPKAAGSAPPPASAAWDLGLSTPAETSIEILAPLDSQHLSSDIVSVNGRWRGERPSLIMVGTRRAVVASDGTFTAEVHMPDGRHLLQARALAGERTTDRDEVSVEVDATAPVVTLSAPATGGIFLVDRVSIAACVDDRDAATTLSGQPVTLDARGCFTAELALPIGTWLIEVVAVDRLGRVGLAQSTITRLAAAEVAESPPAPATAGGHSTSVTGTRPVDDKARKQSEFRGFVFLREEEFSCGGVSHRLEVYRHERFAQAAEFEANETAPDVEFVLVPGGAFFMGSQEFPDESPVHERTVGDLLVARTEVSLRVWAGVMQEETRTWMGHTIGADPRQSAAREHPLRPVARLDWDDAGRFCRITRLRLPSEAEWEYLCRSGTTTRWSFGDSESPIALFGVVAGKESRVARDRHVGDLEPNEVAARLPNAFGLYDMHGNVAEWVEDFYIDSYDVVPSDQSARGRGWRLLPPSPLHMHRGGSAASSTRDSRSAARDSEKGDLLTGFRPVMDAR